MEALQAPLKGRLLEICAKSSLNHPLCNYCKRVGAGQEGAGSVG
jgi:hypothetical protein